MFLELIEPFYSLVLTDLFQIINQQYSHCTSEFHHWQNSRSPERDRETIVSIDRASVFRRWWPTLPKARVRPPARWRRFFLLTLRAGKTMMYRLARDLFSAVFGFRGNGWTKIRIPLGSAWVRASEWFRILKSSRSSFYVCGNEISQYHLILLQKS